MDKDKNANKEGGKKEADGKETTDSAEPSRAKKRWAAILGRVTTSVQQTTRRPTGNSEAKDENLIEEIKRMNQMKKKKAASTRMHAGGVLSLLHSSHHGPGEKMFEKHKYSVREKVVRRRERGSIRAGSIASLHLTDFDNDARFRYPITPEIRIKLEKIKKDAEAYNEKHHEKEKSEKETKSKKDKDGAFSKFLGRIFSANLWETVRAHHRFYKFSPHEHLPDLCRRCRRPLEATLETRFTSVGILFCILLPIIGILLLFVNREFVCVVCDEVYVYGDLTARPAKEFDEEDEGDDNM